MSTPPFMIQVHPTAANPWPYHPEPNSGTPYKGPVAGLKTEMLVGEGLQWYDTPRAFNVWAYTPDCFILTGSLDDSIDVSNAGGNNILDGGQGSNFLTGGKGNDTFYVDGRTSDHNLWSTVKGFHAGDHATVWGVTPTDFALNWLDNQGAAGVGNQGITAVFVAFGKPEIGLTLAGYTRADLTNGRLEIGYGHTPNLPGLPGSDYMTVTGH